jgi:hypothetical protein
MSGYVAEVLADSISPHGARITTFRLRFPRFLLAQFNTHRAISKSARSSRAVPVEKMIAEVESDPVFPIEWGANGRGMQAASEIHADRKDEARSAWWCARNDALKWARRLSACGVHKQVANRPLEPFMWADVVATATTPGWINYFALRCHEATQPEHRYLAVMMARAYRDSTPAVLQSFQWHMPFVTPAEHERLALLRDAQPDLIRASVARCARVSYRMHDGGEARIPADLALAADLERDGHWSPFEHQARPNRIRAEERSGNFVGWVQHRQELPRSVHATFDFSTLDQPEQA